MPNKWANYAVVAVDYDVRKNHIQCCEVRRDLGNSFGSPEYWERSRVVDSVENGVTFVTSTKHPIKKKWQRGADVSIIVVSGTEYLRTDGITERQII